jgi:putative endonuclease
MECETVAAAYAVEKRIQGWSRAKREALIAGRVDLLPALSRKDFTKRTPDA